jgi:hypothetical protein
MGFGISVVWVWFESVISFCCVLKVVRQPLFSRLYGNPIFGLWQDCEAIIWVERFTRSIPPVNELIFELGL